MTTSIPSAEDATATPGVRAPDWLVLLGTSERGGRDYMPMVEGELPAGLNGALYRNGPGLFERGGGEPLSLEAPAAFMWHALNAYERVGEVIADFVGYDEPDHFIGGKALFRTLMENRMGLSRSPGKIRRYVIDPAARTLREEIIDGGESRIPHAG